MDGEMDGQMNGRKDGWMNERKEGRKEGRKKGLIPPNILPFSTEPHRMPRAEVWPITKCLRKATQQLYGVF